MLTEQIIYTSPKAFIKMQYPKPPRMIGPLGSLHIHSELEILYVTSGYVEFHTEDNVFPVDTGDIVFINSHIPHYGDVLKDYTTFIMTQFSIPETISEPSLKYLSRFLRKTNYPCHVFKKGTKEADYLAERLQELYNHHKNRTPAHEYLMTAKKFEILYLLYSNNYLVDENAVLNLIDLNAIMPIITFIDENYSKPISLADISKSIHLHKNYICRLFKHATGKTVMDYLNFIRICNAQSLLKSGKSVAETSELIGFSSPSYFNKVFKKFFFFAPSEYKKQLMLEHLQ